MWISVSTRARPNCETLWTAIDRALCEVSTFLFGWIIYQATFSGLFPYQTSISSASSPIPMFFVLLVLNVQDFQDLLHCDQSAQSVLYLVCYKGENTLQKTLLHKIMSI